MKPKLNLRHPLYMKHLLIATLTISSAISQTPHEKRLDDAASVLQEVMATPDRAIPQELLNKAECIVVVPALKKGAFIIGGKFGRGYFSCRKPGKIGWSAPAGIKVEGGSIGFQIGGSESDVIMIVQNQRGAQRLLESKFTLGGDAQAAAGPVGRAASADTDVTLRAEILTYSRSRGLFAGISLQGATLRGDDEANKSIYGKAITAKEIIGEAVAPPKAEKLLAALNKYSSRK